MKSPDKISKLNANKAGLTSPAVNPYGLMKVGPDGQLELPESHLVEVMGVHRGRRKRRRLRILIDNGASHLFVSKKFVNRCGLITQPMEVEAHMANKSVSHTSEIVLGLEYSLDGVLESGDFVVLPHMEYDLILGIPWFKWRNPKINYIDRNLKYKAEDGRDISLSFSLDEALARLGTVMAEELDSFLRADPKLRPRLFAVHVKLHVLDGERANIPDDPDLASIINEYVGVVFRDEVQTGVPPDRPGGNHTIPIIPGSKPVNRPMYSLSVAELDELKKQLAELLRLGLIRPSKSPWGSPVLFVEKPGGGMRMCVDYRELNKITIKDRYTLPLISSLRDRLQGMKYFSKIDLKQAYHQVAIDPVDIEKTAFKTRYGHFEAVVCLEGLTSVPATFQRMIQNVLKDGLDVFCGAYLDDIIVYSKTLKEHREHVRWVLQQLAKYQLIAKMSKCEWGKPEVQFLGFLVSEDGIRITPEHIEAIQTFPKPTTVTDIKSFLGLANYFHWFVANLAELTGPLSQLASDEANRGKKRQKIVGWDVPHDKAFAQIKEAIVSAPVLRFFDPSLPTKVKPDASQVGLGAWLAQDDGKGWRPVAFLSRKFTPAEMNYDTRERELLAIHEALRKWRHYLEGIKFWVETDHQSLKWLDDVRILNRRQARWIMNMQSFDFTIGYSPGDLNTVADILSRRPDYFSHCERCRTFLEINSVELGVTSPLLDTIRDTTSKDPLAKVWIEGLENPTLADRSEKHRLTKLKYIDGLIKYGDKERIYVPDVDNLRSRVLFEFHDSPLAGHQGANRTYEKLSREYYWPKMERDVKDYTRSCDTCQRVKAERDLKFGLLHPLEVPEARWTDLGFDFIVDLPEVDGMSIIAVVVDRLTKRIHLFALPTNADAEAVAKAFFANVFKLHGLPLSIVSDRDSKFVSKFWQSLFNVLGTKLKMATARHQQTDGQSENVVGVVKSMITSFLDSDQDTWLENLPFIEFAFNDSVNATTGFTPFELDLGYHPRTPLSLSVPVNSKKGRHSAAFAKLSTIEAFVHVTYTTSPDAQQFVQHLKDMVARAKHRLEDAQHKMAKYHDLKRREDPCWPIGSEVMLLRDGLKVPGVSEQKQQLLSRYVGPFKVISHQSPNYTLQLPPTMSRVHPTFHVERLRLYKSPAEKFDRPVYDRPAPILVNDHEEYVVDAILQHKTNKRTKKLLFLVDWEGYGPEERSWEPRENLEHLDVFKEYCAMHRLH